MLNSTVKLLPSTSLVVEGVDAGEVVDDGDAKLDAEEAVDDGDARLDAEEDKVEVAVAFDGSGNTVKNVKEDVDVDDDEITN